MNEKQPTKLAIRVDPNTDHILGDPDAPITLVEYGSYSCQYCHAAHEVVANLREHFGERMRYVFRHLPISGSDTARPAAVLAELNFEENGQFWSIHDELMDRGPNFEDGELEEVAAKFEIKGDDPDLQERAEKKVQADRRGAIKGGARVTPTFFINGRRYEGAWDEQALAEAMEGSLGHRLKSASLDFVRWGPSTGLLLLVVSILAVVLVNSSLGPGFESFWKTEFSISFGGRSFSLSALKWINDGLLSIFFYVVGLEIKREFTIGHLSRLRVAALPIAASIGGMVIPALIYMAFVPSGPLAHGWGIPIATDTAFAIALVVLLGARVPIELRVFLTAAVIVDDLAAIGVVAVFYSDEIRVPFILTALVIVAILIALNRWAVYRPLPYVVAGLFLWFTIHESGIHATLAGVVLAILTPTRPPGNLNALLAQAESVLIDENKRTDNDSRLGPTNATLWSLDAIFDRIESPAEKILRHLEPWSSYFVLPLFALANAGVLVSLDVIEGHSTLMLAIILGLVVGKPVGIFVASALAVYLGIAEKPDIYSWRQVLGAGAIAGIGFTMSLFIAGQAFGNPDDFAAAKIAVFTASILAGIVGALILIKKPDKKKEPVEESRPTRESPAECEA